jgi:hypothetical protein
MMIKTTKVTYVLPTSLAKRIHDKAKLQGRKIQSLVAELLERGLKH